MRHKIISSFLFIVVFLTFNACVTYYKVTVNGFTGGKLSIPNEKKIFVYANKKAVNPFLEAEISEKMRIALKAKGYIPVEQLSDSDYVLLYDYGIDQGNTYSRTYSYGGTRLNIFSGQLEPTTEVGSATKTIYSRQLLLRLFEIKGLSEQSKPVWVGVVNSRGSSSDLRNVIDYLIVGAFEHFGEDTGKQKNHLYMPSKNPIGKLEKASKGKDK